MILVSSLVRTWSPWLESKELVHVQCPDHLEMSFGRRRHSFLLFLTSSLYFSRVLSFFFFAAAVVAVSPSSLPVPHKIPRTFRRRAHKDDEGGDGRRCDEMRWDGRKARGRRKKGEMDREEGSEGHWTEEETGNDLIEQTRSQSYS